MTDYLTLFRQHLRVSPECSRPGEPMRDGFRQNICQRCGRDTYRDVAEVES